MAGADILGIGTSALLSYQQALQTTSNNISNANTDGYSRQRVDFSTQPGDLAGSYYLGSGVQVDGVQRIFSQFVNAQVTDATATNSRYQTYSQYAEQVDNLLADQTAGLQPALQSFFNSVQGVSNDPSSISARQDLISQGNTLVGRFNTLYQQIDNISGRLNGQIGNDVSNINSLASQIAKLNTQIVSANNSNVVGQPNDLLDKRDALVNKLAQYVSVKTVSQSDGSINVMVGTGQALVVGADVTKLGTASLSGDPNQLDLVFKTQAGDVPVSNIVTGGSLGGLLEARDQVVVQAKNALGRLAIGIGQEFNAQQAKGIDLTGSQGGDFFNVPMPTTVQNSYPSENNASSSGVATYSISDVGKLTTNDYRLSYDGTNWSLKVAGSGQTVTMTPVTGSPGSYTADGLTINVPTTVSAGDSFSIEPTRYAARDITMAATDPREIAAAAPVVGTATQTNTGTGTISGMQTLDPTNANLRDQVTITMTSATTFDVVDNTTGTTLATGQAFNSSGTTVSFNGWQTTIGGNAASGDTFVIAPTGSGDNGNALQLAALQQKTFLQGGTASLGDTYSQLVSDVGTKTQAAQTDAKTHKSLLNQATSMQQSISGVNLDEEAANLLKYQQAYQASAKVISTANSLFQTLINAVS
jgi:flagellar hook-associated protein 1